MNPVISCYKNSRVELSEDGLISHFIKKNTVQGHLFALKHKNPIYINRQPILCTYNKNNISTIQTVHTNQYMYLFIDKMCCVFIHSYAKYIS